MAPLKKASQEQKLKLYHFTHPNHPLQQVFMDEEYNCDGCNTLGFGSRFRCESCDFDLHDHCFSCTSTVSSHLHPHNHLTLVNRSGKAHFCDVCGDMAKGLFYTCGACDFDVHPLCTQLPLNYQHALHPQHLFTLQPSNPNFGPSTCGLCGHTCAYWMYSCKVCCVHVHLECAGSPPEVFSGTRGLPPSTWIPPETSSSCCGDYAVGVPVAVYENNNQAYRGKGGRKIYSVLATLATDQQCQNYFEEKMARIPIEKEWNENYLHKLFSLMVIICILILCFRSFFVTRYMNDTTYKNLQRGDEEEQV